MLLNCDLGESYGSWKMGLDQEVMPYIDQANIACGFHAGDPLTIQKTLALASKHNVSILHLTLYRLDANGKNKNR